ncbi:MAG: anhydro-N-acetylmuramic acid kinase, partial [Verrucomicrobiota bacterium]
MLVLGIMSGTSIDAVDCALCRIEKQSIRLIVQWQVGFPPKLRARLHAAAGNHATSFEAGQLHHDLGRFYAKAALRGPKELKPQLVGLHGQTIFHNPDPQTPATWQIGEPAYLAEALRVPVVSNFRSGDIAAGGQGAPLATMFHVRVFGKRGEHVCVNNLGGISNVTSIDWSQGRGAPRVLSFDTGPANMLIDMAMRNLSGGRKTFDRNGAWASRGRADEELLREWLRHPFFRAQPPKSTGRELFGEPFLHSALRQMKGLSPFDQMATLTEFTARSLALNYRLHLKTLPDRVVVCGGGGANKHLISAIRREVQSSNANAVVQTSEDLV